MYTITLEVNQICNLRCTYCYLGKKTNQKMSERIAYNGLEIAFLNVEKHKDRRLWVDFVGGRGTSKLFVVKAVGGIYRKAGFTEEHFSNIFYYNKWNYSQ